MAISKIRKQLFIFVSTAIFIAIAVVALILARGNIFTDQGIVETGTLRLVVNPGTDYQVFLNEQIQKVPGNNSITGITPGDYDLKIEKAGYAAWHQTTSIRAGLVTDISVQLFPLDLKLEQLSQTNVDRLFFSPSHRYVYYSVINNPLGTNVGIWKQTLSQSNIPLIEEKPLKLTNLTSLISQDITAGRFILEPCLDDTKLLLSTSSATYVLDAGKYNEPGANNQLNLTYPIDQVRWLRNSTNLLIRSGNLLIDYDLDKKSSTIITYQAAAQPIYALSSTALIYFVDGAIFKYTPANNILVSLENVTLPTGITNIYMGWEDANDIVIKTDNMLFYLNFTDSYLGELGEYQLVSLSPSGRNLIVTKDGTNLESIQVNISVARSLVESTKRVTSLPQSTDKDSIVWDIDSNYFVFQKADDAEELLSADYSGNNVTTLLQSANLPSPATYNMLENNTGIVLKVFDNQDQATEGGNANIYKLSY